MAIKAADQISIVDLTDAYSVMLTSESYIFPGTTTAAKAGSCTTQIIALCGAEQVAASVDLSEITVPDKDGIVVTKDSDTVSPTLTVTVNTNFNVPGDIVIPISVDGGKVTISKRFSVAIAFTGETGATGEAGADGTKWYTGTAIATTTSTATIYSSSGVTNANVGDMYLNTSKGYTYKCTVAGNASTAKWSYVGSLKGSTGSTGAGAVWYTGTAITGTSTTATIFSGSGVASAKVGDMYLNTDTYDTYRCSTAGSATVAKWVYSANIKGETGETGAAGADAITMAITSSNGTIFKNSAIETVLTAHIYQSGSEITDATALAALGTVNWYKDGGTDAVATGRTLTISAGNVDNKATYIA